jgi:hypothetical protein
MPDRICTELRFVISIAPSEGASFQRRAFIAFGGKVPALPPARRHFFLATSTTLRIKAVNEIDAVMIATIRIAICISIKITSLWR